MCYGRRVSVTRQSRSRDQAVATTVGSGLLRAGASEGLILFHGWRVGGMSRFSADPANESWVTAEKDRLRVTMSYRSVGGALVCNNVKVEALDGSELTAPDVRKPPLGGLIGAGMRILAATPSPGRVPEADAPSPWYRGVLDQMEGRAAGPVTDETYAQLAEHYVALAGRGVRKPVAVLSSASGLTESQVRERLREARKRELLTSAGQGRVGGKLTSKAQKILRASGK